MQKKIEQCLRVFSKLPKVNRGGMCQPIKTFRCTWFVKNLY